MAIHELMVRTTVRAWYRRARFLFLLRRVRLICQEARHIVLSVALVSGPEIRRINARYRRSARLTNVLAFCWQQTRQRVEGEIVLCPAVVKAEAQLFDRTYSQHLDCLFAHGLLHVLGYDHQTPAQTRQMEKLESQIIGA